MNRRHLIRRSITRRRARASFTTSTKHCVTYDKSNPAQFVPLLADFIPEAVSADDGSVTYTFVIPRGIQFHNGR